jgi:CPA2 family monovalent cation:H+ antiporter-2
MPHKIDLILTLTAAFTAALGLGFATQKLKLSPIVGYLLAGVLVGPFTPGYVADNDIATQFAEIGVILLMFGVGLHFHLKDLLAVRKIAIPGALVQIAVATALGAVVTRMLGWSWTAGIVFGMAVSVASTVVLTRVLADNRALHTPSGHIAIGWLIVEDLFTILVLVLLPALFSSSRETAGGGGVAMILGWALLKLAALIGFALIAGQRIIPWFLGYVARTGSRDLFTLAVLVLALGIAVGSAKLFGASMALGAFLAGMIVGQSEFSARSASDALPMRDAFAVLFFVSVGMLFDPTKVGEGWPLMLATLGIVVVGKPLAALGVVLLFRRPLASALSIAVALAQIGEFSFILAALGSELHILPSEATNALVVASVVSITLNPLLYKCIEPVVRSLERAGISVEPKHVVLDEMPEIDEAAHCAIVVGYGPVGRTLSRILRDNGIQVVVVETNLKTVQDLRAKGESAVYGDASLREVLHHAGIEKADGLIIAASEAPAHTVVKAARELNPEIRVLTRSTYLREAERLREAGASAVFSSEGEVALSMTAFLMRQLGATDEQIDRERDRVRAELF